MPQSQFEWEKSSAIADVRQAMRKGLIDARLARSMVARLDTAQSQSQLDAKFEPIKDTLNELRRNDEQLKKNEKEEEREKSRPGMFGQAFSKAGPVGKAGLGVAAAVGGIAGAASAAIGTSPRNMMSGVAGAAGAASGGLMTAGLMSGNPALLIGGAAIGAVAAIAKLAATAGEASEALKDFSPTLAGIYGLRDLRETFRNMRVGGQIAGSAGVRENAMEGLMAALEPIKVQAIRIGNWIATGAAVAATQIVEILKSLWETISAFIAVIGGDTKEWMDRVKKWMDKQERDAAERPELNAPFALFLQDLAAGRVGVHRMVPVGAAKLDPFPQPPGPLVFLKDVGKAAANAAGNEIDNALPPIGQGIQGPIGPRRRR